MPKSVLDIQVGAWRPRFVVPASFGARAVFPTYRIHLFGLGYCSRYHTLHASITTHKFAGNSGMMSFIIYSFLYALSLAMIYVLQMHARITSIQQQTP